MPFTPTHVAAALPALTWLRRRGAAPASALVIGTMIPDVAVFLPRAFDYGAAHSVRGLFTQCLPLGLAAFLAWEHLLKRPLADLVPDALRRRLPGAAGPAAFSWRALGWAAGLVVAGAASHVLWDSFTHAGRWGVRAVPALDEVWLRLPAWAPTGDRAVRGYRLGQYGSTVAFLPLVAGYAAWRLRRTPPADVPPPALPPWRRRAMAAALLLAPAAAGAGEFWNTLPLAPPRVAAVRAVVAGALTLAAGVFIYALAHRLLVRPPSPT